MPISWLLAIIAIFAAVIWGLLVWKRQKVEESEQFLTEVKSELKKVTWPGRKEVINTTSVVIVTVIFFGLYLSLIDIIVSSGRDSLFKAISTLAGR